MLRAGMRKCHWYILVPHLGRRPNHHESPQYLLILCCVSLFVLRPLKRCLKGVLIRALKIHSVLAASSLLIANETGEQRDILTRGVSQSLSATESVRPAVSHVDTFTQHPEVQRLNAWMMTFSSQDPAARCHSL